jgi:exodeoxyribonuclease V alpha subunit
MKNVLQAWVRAGWLRDVDEVFAAFLVREAGEVDPLLVLGAALASHQLGRGHVCLDLQAVLEDAAGTLALPPEERANDSAGEEQPAAPAQVLAGVTLAQWQQALANPALVGAAASGGTPLVLEGARLYLRRFWQHEQSLRAAIGDRLEAAASQVAEAEVRSTLDALFPASAVKPDWQKIACALALRGRFTVVTGGPGTGKTTTVLKLLAMLQHLALSSVHPRRLRIRLAAPTGKAAARLSASITNAVKDLPLDALEDGAAVRAAIPTEVNTVHRLLGSMAGSRRFRHDAANPLPLDVLVLDEASMVDLETMAAVLAALPPNARLVLLGDKDQLASVEAGGVLGELCRRADQGHYRADTGAWLQAVTGESVPDQLLDPQGAPLDQAIVKLRRSYRFDAESGIGQLADAVNRGDVEAVRAIRTEGRSGLAWLELQAGDAALRKLVLEGGYRDYLQRVADMPPADAGLPAFDTWARAVLKTYAGFQLLCAVRRGPHGVEGLNRRIAALLHAQKLIAEPREWYLGRPVMVTQNDYALGLMNGDVGITLALPAPPDSSEPGKPLLRVAFEDSEGGIRWVLPSRLRQVETVFAMTVHKSQGSEFGHAALLLPAARSAVLTRELVYTGITRARERFTVALAAGADDVLEHAIRQRIRRAGGPLDPTTRSSDA